MVERARIVLSAEDRTRLAFESAKRNIGQLNATAATVGRTLGPLIGTVGLLGAGLGALSFKRLIDGIDALNDVKDATGASIENISALEDIGARTGTTFEAVSSTLVRFNKILREAKPGSEVEATIEAIGLSVDELRRKDPAQALRDVAIALNQYDDDGRKARITEALFKKNLQEIAPFLKDLAEAGTLNATVTTKQAEEAEKFNKQLFQLQTNIKNSARAITSDMLPALNTFLERLNGIKAGGGFFSSIGKEIDANLISDRLRVVTSEIERLDAYIQKNPAVPALRTRMAQLRTEADALQRQALAASDALKKFGDAATPAKAELDTPAAPKPSAPDIPDPAGANKAAAQALANLRKLVDGNLKAIDENLGSTQDLLKFNEQFSQTLYQTGLQSLEQFYADQDRLRQENLAAIRKATEDTIAERQKELNSPLLRGPERQADRQEIENQIAAARAKLTAAQREADQAAQLSTVERQRATEALSDQVKALDAQIGDLARGSDVESDLLGIAQRVREAGRLLVQGGASDEEAAQRAAEFGRLLELQREFNVARDNFARITNEAAAAEELLLITSRERGDGLLKTEDAVYEARSKALRQIEELVAKTQEMLRLNPGNSALADGLRELQVEAARLRASVDPRKLRLDAAGDDIGSTIADGFQRAVFEGEKLKDVVNDIGAQIVSIVTQEVITKPLAESIANIVKGAGGQGTGQNIIGQLFGLNRSSEGGGAADSAVTEAVAKITGLGAAAGGSADILGKIPQLAAIPATASISALGAAAQIAAGNLLQIGVAGAAGSSGIGSLGLGGLIGGGGGFGTGANFGNLDLGQFFHKGGIVGKDGTPTRYHTGGIAGLQPDEVPAILQRGEEVLTKRDPRHRENASGRGGPITVNVNVPSGTTRESSMQIGARAAAALQRAQRTM